MENLWNGFACEEFEFEGVKAIVVSPAPGTAVGRLALKTLYWNAFPDIEIDLLKNGYHLAYVQRESRFPTDEACHRSARFIKYVAGKYGLSEKCTFIGMSLGGAHAVRTAGFYPELVSCIHLDAPVLNYSSFPGKMGSSMHEKVWDNEFLTVYPGMKRYQLTNFSDHPMNMTDTLLAHKIPVVLVYGTEDALVPYQENGLLLEQAYEGTGLMKVVRVKLRGHHPHGTTSGGNGEIVQFLLDHGQC